MSGRYIAFLLTVALTVAGLTAIFYPRPDVSDLGRYTPPPPTTQSSREPAILKQSTKSSVNSEAPATVQRVSGQVLFADTNAPAPDVVVKARSSSSDDDPLFAETNNNGAFYFDGLVPDTEYTLMVERAPAGYVGEKHWGVKLLPGEHETGIKFNLITGGLVSGSVTDKSITYRPGLIGSQTDPESLMGSAIDQPSLPLSGVVVKIESHLVSRETTTTNYGRFTFENLPPDRYTVEAVPPDGALPMEGHWTGRSRVVVLGPCEEIRNADFWFRFDGVSITGTVTDRDGDPVSGATITAEPQHDGVERNSGHQRPSTAHATTDEEGQYMLENLSPMNIRRATIFISTGHLQGYSKYKVRAEAPGYGAQEILVPMMDETTVTTAGALIDWSLENEHYGQDGPTFPEIPLPKTNGRVIEEIDFQLAPGASISGTVIDNDGVEMSDVAVRLVRNKEDHGDFLELSPVPPESVRTDDNGAFQLSGIAAGEYVFAVTNDSPLFTHEIHERPIRFEAGEQIDGYTVVADRLENLGEIEGKVRDVSGAVPDEWSVEVKKVTDPRRDYIHWGRVDVKNKANGVFRIYGLVGDVTVRAKAPGYGTEVQTVPLDYKEVKDISFTLDTEAIVEGYLAANGAVSGGSLQLLPSRKDGESFFGHADGQGYYKFHRIPAGQYLLSVQREVSIEGFASRRYESRWITAGTGTTTNVDFELGGRAALEGTLTLPDTHEGAMIALRRPGATGPFRLNDYPSMYEDLVATAHPNETGEYRIVEVPAGTYVVEALCYNYDQKTREYVDIVELRQTVRLGGGEPAELDFDLLSP